MIRLKCRDKRYDNTRGMSMRKIWLPGGEPGLEQGGTAYRYSQTGIVGRGVLCFVGFMAARPDDGGIILRHRHSAGFEVDNVDTTRETETMGVCDKAETCKAIDCTYCPENESCPGCYCDPCECLPADCVTS